MAKLKLYTLITVIFAAAKCVQINGAVNKVQNLQWTHKTSFSSNIEVKWIASDPEYITFEMKGPSRGYIGIGFSPTGGMAGADIIIGWVDAKGKPHLLDMFGTHNGQPVLDTLQSLELLGGKEDESGTSITFRRKWDTCDDQDLAIGDDTVRLIWATAEVDPTETPTKGYLPVYHGHKNSERGVKSVHLKAPQSKSKSSYPSDVKYVDFKVDNVPVPKTETYYHCRIMRFPRLQKKHHITSVRPLISNESYPFVHHIAVYRCHVPEYYGQTAEQIFEKYVNDHGTDCYAQHFDQEMLLILEFCFEFRFVIVKGSEGDIYPEHMGNPIGGSDRFGDYHRVEVHYENPEGKELTDSSGVRIFYTPQLRQHDTGMLFTGHRITPFHTIPPRQTNYTVYSFCGSECTQTLPPEGLKVYSVLLHAHLTGRKITLRHIRNGKELPPIAQDNHLDFNYQQFRILKEEVTVLPGDELITECTHSTEHNDTFVYGGLSTRREMCQAFLVYYPEIPLIDCRSQPELYTYLNAIGVQRTVRDGLIRKLAFTFDSKLLPKPLQDKALIDDSMMIEKENGNTDDITHDLFRNIIILNPKALEGYDLHEYMMGLNWSDKDFVRSVEEKRKIGKHYLFCHKRGGGKIRTSRDSFPFPVYEPYKVPQKPCLLARSSGGHSFKEISDEVTFTEHVTAIINYVNVVEERKMAI